MHLSRTGGRISRHSNRRVKIEKDREKEKERARRREREKAACARLPCENELVDLAQRFAQTVDCINAH